MNQIEKRYKTRQSTRCGFVTEYSVCRKRADCVAMVFTGTFSFQLNVCLEHFEMCKEGPMRIVPLLWYSHAKKMLRDYNEEEREKYI